MDSRFTVEIRNEYGDLEKETYKFASKADAKKFIDEQIDGITAFGYVEDDSTKDSQNEWLFTYGTSELNIILIEE